tara:strand:- start:1617 stop:1766 length:150 start_codon:yes stop_codon:yes gene_type:complete
MTVRNAAETETSMLLPADLKIACSANADRKLSNVGSLGKIDGTPLKISG